MQYAQESYIRLEKIQLLKKNWFVVYANRFTNKTAITDLLNNEDLQQSELLLQSGAKAKYRTSGRIMLFRNHGKLSFAKIIDNTWAIQLAFSKNLLVFNNKGKRYLDEIKIEEQIYDPYQFLNKFIDVGDYIGVEGELFLTNHGEKTLFVSNFTLLSKTVRPLPDKFHGLNDKEAIYRQRYLDLIMDQDSYRRFIFRSEFIHLLREFYHQEGFVEITTPILWNSASWAAAKPFITYHNDFKQDMFLRIAPEVALKKATVGRFEKVFEFAINFRNEGTDPSHMQEFSVVEHYAVGWDYKDNMAFTERMFDYIFQKTWLSKIISVKDKEGNVKQIDFSTPWKRIDYIKGVSEASGIDITQYQEGDEKKLVAELHKRNITFENMEVMGVPTLIDYLYKKVLRPGIIGPAFVYNYPKIMQPLARQSDDNPNIVEQFQLVVNGRELNKAYSELVDPEVQVKNFLAQKQALQRGDEEATDGDYDFVLAMEYGMPPQSGFWMGIERVLSILLEQENLRDVYLFPIVKSSNIDPLVFENFYATDFDSNKKLIHISAEDGLLHLRFDREKDYMLPYYEKLLQESDVSYQKQGDSLICEKTVMIKGKPIEKFTKQLNKKLENMTFSAKHFINPIDFDRVKERCQSFLEHLESKKIYLKKVLLKYQTAWVFENEFARTLDLLKNIEENREYFAYQVEQIATFLPKNQVLYAFACFCILPSFMTKKLLVRKPKAMLSFFDEFISILDIQYFFPNIEILATSSSEFLGKVTAMKKAGIRSVPETDVVIFTGTAEHADALRWKFSSQTLFIANGSGHNPVVIAANADLDSSVDAVCELQLYNQGEDYAASNAILVHEKIYSAFLEKLKEKIWDYSVGDYENAKVWPLTDGEILGQVTKLLIENSQYLNADLENSARIEYSKKLVYPTLIEKDLSLWWNYTELFSPVFFLQRYEDEKVLASYFENINYKQKAMYITLYGDEKYITDLMNGNIEGIWELHRKDTFLHNQHLRSSGVVRGGKPYGGYGILASSISYQGTIINKPICPQKDIYEMLIKNDIANLIK